MLFQASSFSFKRAATAAALLLLITAQWKIYRHERNRHHELHITLDDYLPKHKSQHMTIPDPKPSIAQTLCGINGFPAYTRTSKRKHITPSNPQQRRVYDLILLSTELDWLEIRLNTLFPYVDYFIIVESPTTFTGRPKPLALKDSWDRFAAFHYKIIHRVVEDRSPSTYIWDHEDWQRNALLHEVFPSLAGTFSEPEENDVLVVSDVDEIPRPETVFLLRHCDFPARLTLRSDFYYYSFQWKHRGPQWAHPEATVWRGSETLAPNSLRQGLLDSDSDGGWALLARYRRWRDTASLANAGWHCSSCFSTIAEMQTKMHSFSHQDLDTAENNDAETMMRRVREGRDLFGREDQVYDRVERAEMDFPPYIEEANGVVGSRGRFEYLLNRDGENAGFDDWAFVDPNGTGQ